MKRWILPFLLMLTILAGYFGFYVYEYLFSPIQDPGKITTIHIEPGNSFSQISQLLQKQGIIQDSFKFTLLGKISGKAKQVQAGEFRLNTGWSRVKLLTTLTSGQAILHKLQIPEGLTWWETARIINDSGLASFECFAQAVQNQTLLNKYNIPGATAEGFLFPNTYFLPKSKHTTGEKIAELMLQEFWKQAQNHLWEQQIPGQERIKKVVTLASLVEKETAVPEERKRIAGVYVNRLKRNMLLQCDPTVIYGLGPNFDGNLRKKDLKDKKNEYNTYINRGLPPTPICSPGLQSLKAALNPEKHNFLYFVSKGNGRHVFSRTLKEHNKAVRKYQLN